MHRIPKMLSLLAPWPAKQCCTVTPDTGPCCFCCEYPSALIIKASNRQQINLDLVSKGGYIELDGVGPIDNKPSSVHYLVSLAPIQIHTS